MEIKDFYQSEKDTAKFQTLEDQSAKVIKPSIELSTLQQISPLGDTPVEQSPKSIKKEEEQKVESEKKIESDIRIASDLSDDQVARTSNSAQVRLM